MNEKHLQRIVIKTTINKSVEDVWKSWTKSEHIMKWNQASEDWHTTKADNDLRVGGQFLSRMEAKDGSAGFDFSGIYDEVDPYKIIAYTLEDNRKVNILFNGNNNQTEVVETFDAESEYSLEMQKEGWQSILDQFKVYTEEKF